MTTSAYLDSVVKILPAVQARNIVDLLNELKVSGEIRNADEYSKKLKELSVLVNDTNPKPSFKQIRSIMWHLTNADSHNMMLKAAQLDLSAAYQQVDEIGIKVDDHHFLIMENLCADMERGLVDQENTISRLEWLANQNNEFSIALVNSFISSSLLKIPRSDVGAEALYFDNRTYQSRTESELPSAVVDEYSQRLILDVDNEPRVLPISARLLTDSSSYGTQIQVDVDNDILNIIDGTRGTYWTRNVYLSDKVAQVNTVIEFDLGAGKDINYIVIEGAAEVPFFIDSIVAIAPDGHRISLLSEQREINGWDRIDFNRVLARGVQVTFVMKSYVKVDYVIDPKGAIWDAFVADSEEYTESDVIDMFGPLASEVLSSQNLIDLLNIPSGESGLMDAYLYPFALDNVWFGNGIYQDSGIFVSDPLKSDNFGIIAVQAVEGTTTDEAVDNSIEYEIIRKDTSPKYQEIKFPIPKLDQTAVISERLILTKKITDSAQNDAGALRFCPYVNPAWTILDGHPVHVYKNGEELQPGVAGGYDISISLDPDGSKLYWTKTWNDEVTDIHGRKFADTRDFAAYTLTPQKMWIKIRQPDPSAVYTVDYTIRTSDSYVSDNTVWLDENKLVFLSEGGRVYFRRENPDVTVTSEIYLQITMRRNTASQYSCPYLDEYAVLGATYYS
jgi:hypothetical protein